MRGSFFRHASLATGLGLALAWSTSCWAQLTVTDGLSLWLDATDPSTLFQDEDMLTQATDGDEVRAWADKSDNEYHAIADFDGPFLEEGTLGGQDTLAFNGGAQGAALFVDPLLEVNRPYSIFIAQQSFSGGRTLQSATVNWLHGSWGASFANFADGFVGSVPVEFNRPVVVDTTGTPEGESTFFINNFNATNDPSPVGSPGQLGLGSVGQFAGEAANALVSEVIVYDRVLSAPELTSVREYLYGKYNTTDFVPDLGAENNTVLSGELRTFSGGDEGEGLDLLGDFAYALNIGGFEVTVGDAEFAEATLDGPLTPGVNITNAVNEIPGWFGANFGESIDDIELGMVAGSIRFGGDLTVEFDVEAGQSYKLQLLFAESCCDRGFDITVEEELVVDNLYLPDLQNGVLNGGEFGGVYSNTITAGDDLLTIHLGGKNPRAADNLPILNGVTLERVEDNFPLGDFNQNGILDIEDINLLAWESGSGDNNPAFDLNADNVVDSKDVSVWAIDLRGTWMGDANLDGEFNSSDLVAVFQDGKFELDEEANWAQGDWNGDHRFGSGDLVTAFQDGGFELGPRGPAAAVPEPSALVLLGLGISLLGRKRPRTQILQSESVSDDGLTLG